MMTTTSAATDAVGQQSQTCACCLAPTPDPQVACWVCIEQARNMPAQLEASCSAQEDTLRATIMDGPDRRFIATMLMAYPETPFRDIVDGVRARRIG